MYENYFFLNEKSTFLNVFGLILIARVQINSGKFVSTEILTT
ncbi:hypothetical protein CLU99_3285 [Flavobacterium sp. 2]|nr:hypothetical protein CLU99_3285 [Flavobacterium sp. 2]